MKFMWTLSHRRVTPLNNWHGGSLTRLVGDLLEDLVDALSSDVRVGAILPGNWLYSVNYNGFLRTAPSPQLIHISFVYDYTDCGEVCSSFLM